jgi:hypothetical protein
MLNAVLKGKRRGTGLEGIWLLILAPGGDGFTIGTTRRVRFVDGQQRLTTLELFLAVIRELRVRLNVLGWARSFTII